MSDVRFAKVCHSSLHKYQTKTPTYSSFSLRNFKRTVNLQGERGYYSEKKPPVRNESICPFPYDKPKCCTHAYETTLARSLQRKVAKYGLTRPTEIRFNRLNRDEWRQPLSDDGYRVVVPECIYISESDSDEEDKEYEYHIDSDSVSQCSGCSTLNEKFRKKRHEIFRKDWKKLLKENTLNPCNEIIREEMRKYGKSIDLIPLD